MPTWDSADLLSRCIRHRRRPDTDESTEAANWYALLTEAESHWKPVIVSHYPNDMYGAPQALTTSDGGATYVFPSSEVDPLAVQVYTSATGYLLVPGPYWDDQADYVLERGQIRITNGRTQTFSSGPYARFVTGPQAIDASTDSTIQPARLRILLVYYACMLDASRGGLDDPSFYRAEMQIAAFGDPAIPGDVGLIGALKARNNVGGLAARGGGGRRRWWHPV